MHVHRPTCTAQSKLQQFLFLKTSLLLSLCIPFTFQSSFIVCVLSSSLSCSLSTLNLLPCFFPLFLSLTPSALYCLLDSFTLMAASLITIERWSQSSLFFLTRTYLWEPARPTTWGMNRGSNAMKYSQIFLFPTFSLEKSRYVGRKSLSIALDV